MPAFRVSITDKSDRGEDQELFFDNGSTAYLSAMGFMLESLDCLDSKASGNVLLDMIDAGGNLAPVIDFFNAHNKVLELKIERVLFQKPTSLSCINQERIKEARKRVMNNNEEWISRAS